MFFKWIVRLSRDKIGLIVDDIDRNTKRLENLTSRPSAASLFKVIKALRRRVDDVPDTRNALHLLVCGKGDAHIIQETVALLLVEPA